MTPRFSASIRLNIARIISIPTFIMGIETLSLFFTGTVQQICLPWAQIPILRFPLGVVSSSPRGCGIGRRWPYKILTKTPTFKSNKSGFAIWSLSKSCFMSLVSQFCWVGGGQRYRDDFSENRFFKLWPLTHSIDSDIIDNCQSYVTTMQKYSRTY